MNGMEYVDYLISKTEEMTRKLNESSDSEGICADMGGVSTYRNPSTSSGRGSMTSSSINNDRMFLSTISTPRRPPSRIPALMTKSLHSTRSQSTPSHHNQPSANGSCEQLCNSSFDGFRIGFRRLETEMLLSRSQERRQMRASSYDPRCLLALHPTSSHRLSTSASASISNQFHQMTSSSIHPTSSYSRLLPKRPQWVRNQPASEIQLAESTVSLDWKKDGFYLDSDEDSESLGDSDSESEDVDVMETPKSRRKAQLFSVRRVKERNRKTFRNTLRRLHSSSKPSESATSSEFSDFLCVSSPFFHLLIAFLLRILLFFTENFL